MSTPSRADLEAKVMQLKAELAQLERDVAGQTRSAWTVPAEERTAHRAAVLGLLSPDTPQPLSALAAAAGVDEHCALAVLFDLCREGVARRGVKAGGWLLGDERPVRRVGPARRGVGGRTPMPPTGHPPGR